MHWLVEVSRVGDTVASERYCIEARRWQSALQEARRMRGDAGALPKLTIELLDSGYRAVDPELKVRYVVSEAPPGMPLTDGARTVLSTHPPPAELIVPMPASSPSHPLLEQTPTLPLAPSAPTPDDPAAAVASAASDAASVEAALPEPTVPEPAARPTTSKPPPSVTAQVIRQRDEKPTEANPIAYRELARAVKSGTSRPDVEALLAARFEELRATMSAETRRFVQLAVFDHVFVKRPVRPPLATLLWKDWRGDPVIAFPGFGEPLDSMPPSSTSVSRMPSWAASMMTSVAPQPGSTAPPATSGSAAPSPSAPSTPALAAPAGSPLAATLVSSAPAAAEASSVAPASTMPPAPRPASASPPAAAPGSVRPMPVVSVGPSNPPPAAASTRPSGDPPPIPAPPPPEAPVALASVRAPADLVAAEEARLADAVQSARPDSAPSRRSDPMLHPGSPPSSRRSDPALARRRAPGEDLIGELFERMHDLNFMADIVSGADYVLNVIYDLIPCEAMLVHVLDLGRREFVVVRAHGQKAREALLFRTPDTDPLVVEVMRQRSIVSNGATPHHSGAFELLGVHARQVLSGSARLGGRYLGFIEIANPIGGAPFHEGEAGALEYVCEQFAEFVAARPVVLDEDMVLRA